MTKALLIDIDNTLLDFDAYVKTAMRDGFEKFGLIPYEDSMYPIFEKINSEFWRGLENGTITYEQLLKDRWNTIFSHLGITFDGQVFEKYFKGCLFDSAIPVEGAKELLEHLKERYILCVASNGPYAQQVNRLTLSGMLPYFSKLFISESIGHQKPSGEFFDHCLNELNKDRGDIILASEVMMIGDSLTSDMTGAINKGMKTCFFDKKNTGNTSTLAIDYIVTSLSEIHNIL